MFNCISNTCTFYAIGGLMPENKDPWGEGTPWKSSVQFFTYLRGCLRKAWTNHPTKFKLIKEKRIQVKNPNPRGNKPTVWGAVCSMCNREYILKDTQVDHINPAGSLRKKEDIQGFVERLLWVTEDDLRIVCKPCNNALALADKQGITYEEAMIQKKAIEWEKKNKGVQKQREVLKSLGVKDTDKLKAKEIRKAYVNYLKGEK